MSESPLLAVVVGPPRSGFTLLSSVLVHLSYLLPSKLAGNYRQVAVNTLVETLGWSVSDAVVELIAAEGLVDDLVYNRNFRELTGGPKWIDGARPDRACFRKYIGIRGGGDLNLVTSHPRITLERDIVVHSHVDPALWLKHPGYVAHRKFASIRNPIGILNSSVFSLNALASEYIQRFLPLEEDGDELRQHQALYKMTDLNFFGGLVSHLKRYLEGFLAARNGYTVMRWEDLIDRPVPTIQALAGACALSVSDEEAAAIWAQLDHRNLTGAHQHNYRRGFGIVGNWRRWLTNHHLRFIRETGLGPIIEALGYDATETLDEQLYTPFQREVSRMIDRGVIYDDYPDRDLFTFAFNKSNIDISQFPFRSYPWREHTQIERSCFRDPSLEVKISSVAETAAARFNGFLEDLLAGDFATPDQALQSARRTFQRHEREFERSAPARFSEARHACDRVLDAGRPASYELPRLVKTVGVYNIVYYRGRFFGLPQALGPVDLSTDEVDDYPGVVIAPDQSSVERQIQTAPNVS